ncbi:MAG TPA: hypothetical protein VK972_08535 [Wenzhouxiangella sp.]|nr:hypothetical protein [Wenzhouxiangella sp.]
MRSTSSGSGQNASTITAPIPARSDLNQLRSIVAAKSESLMFVNEWRRLANLHFRPGEQPRLKMHFICILGFPHQEGTP